MIWTPPYLASVLRRSAEEVLQPSLRGLDSTPESRVEWAQIQTAQRLVEAHGFERALAILNGEDRAAQADLAAWKRLGAGRAA